MIERLDARSQEAILNGRHFVFWSQLVNGPRRSARW
jgi:hypothetical protein